MGPPCGGPGAAPRPGNFFEFSKCKFTDFPLKIGSLRKGRKKNKQLEVPKFGHTLLKTLGTMIESKRFVVIEKMTGSGLLDLLFLATTISIQEEERDERWKKDIYY